MIDVFIFAICLIGAIGIQLYGAKKIDTFLTLFFTIVSFFILSWFLTVLGFKTWLRKNKLGEILGLGFNNTVKINNRIGYDSSKNQHFITAEIHDPKSFNSLTIDTTKGFYFDYVEGFIVRGKGRAMTKIQPKCFNTSKPVTINDSPYVKTKGSSQSNIQKISLVFYVSLAAPSQCSSSDFTLTERKARLVKLQPNFFSLNGVPLTRG
jgi:hypothetical protein